MEEKRIKGVKHVLVKCNYCGKEVWKRKTNFKNYPITGCSKECLANLKRTGSYFTCKNCGKVFYRTKSQQKRSKSGDYFCSRSCATVINNIRHKSGSDHSNWKDGLASYRDRALRFYGSSCMNPNCVIQKVGIEIPEIMLDVHHLKGRDNNDLENLIVLCVWCHAKKTRGLE